jgi:hypothetical protein
MLNNTMIAARAAEFHLIKGVFESWLPDLK